MQLTLILGLLLCTLVRSIVSIDNVNDPTPLSPEDDKFWGRFLRYDLSVPMKPPVKPPVKPPTPSLCGYDTTCNDNNTCTVDTCVSGTGCKHVPVKCGVNEACDSIDGSCRNVDSIRPCIAIIDESDNLSDFEVNTKWASFRTAFPTRPFCLLQPAQTGGRLFIPTMPDFLSDPRATFAVVNRDGGSNSSISDWFDLCGYSALTASGIDFVGLFVDESGSMTRATVQASLDNFFRDLNNAQLSFCLVFDPSENWIDPFNTALGLTGGGGDCGSAPTTP